MSNKKSLTKEERQVIDWLRSRKRPYRSYYDTLDESGPFNDGLMAGLAWAANCIEQFSHREGT